MKITLTFKTTRIEVSGTIPSLAFSSVRCETQRINDEMGEDSGNKSRDGWKLGLLDKSARPIISPNLAYLRDVEPESGN